MSGGLVHCTSLFMIVVLSDVRFPCSSLSLPVRPSVSGVPGSCKTAWWVCIPLACVFYLVYTFPHPRAPPCTVNTWQTGKLTCPRFLTFATPLWTRRIEVIIKCTSLHFTFHTLMQSVNTPRDCLQIAFEKSLKG